jgi:hypothetical protein
LPSTISVVSLSAITLPFPVAFAITGVKSCIPSYPLFTLADGCPLWHLRSLDD